MISTELCKELYAGLFLRSIEMLTYPPMLKPVFSSLFFSASLEVHVPCPSILITHSAEPFSIYYTSLYRKLFF